MHPALCLICALPVCPVPLTVRGTGHSDVVTRVERLRRTQATSSRNFRLPYRYHRISDLKVRKLPLKISNLRSITNGKQVLLLCLLRVRQQCTGCGLLIVALRDVEQRLPVLELEAVVRFPINLKNDPMSSTVYSWMSSTV